MKVVRCSTLSDEALRVLATHLIAEFGHLYPGWDLADATRELSEDPGQGLPLHLAAIEDETILGVASVIPDDEVTGWEGEDWWLANVLVLPEHRGRGIGKELINRAIGVARDSGAHDFHLVTETAEAWYEKQGWKNVGVGDVHGHVMTVMLLELT